MRKKAIASHELIDGDNGLVALETKKLVLETKKLDLEPKS